MVLNDLPAAVINAIISEAGEGYVVTNPRLPDNPIIYANPHIVEMTGYPVEEIVGRNCRFLQGPDSDPNTVASIREAIKAGDIFRGELLNYRKDGTPFWNLLLIYPLRDAANEISYFVGIQTDVTNTRERAEEQAELAHSLRLADMGVALAHDLRNILACVTTSLEVIEHHSSPVSRQRALDISYGAIGRATRITEQLLNFARREPLQRQRLDLNQVINRVLSGQPREIIYEQPDHPILLTADPTQLEQAFANIVHNAIKATPAEGDITITIAGSTNDSVELTFRDSGHGIPEQVMPRLFAPFASGGGPNSGIGLGLAIVHRIITEHGGSVRVESRESVGTCFTICLPLAA